MKTRRGRHEQVQHQAQEQRARHRRQGVVQGQDQQEGRGHEGHLPEGQRRPDPVPQRGRGQARGEGVGDVKDGRVDVNNIDKSSGSCSVLGDFKAKRK